MDGAATTEALTPETAVRMLRASLVEPPRSLSVAWCDGREGRILSTEDYSGATFINELRAMMLDARPKGEGPALLPAQVQPDSLRRPRSAVVAPTLAILDYDAGAITLDEARAMMRGWGSLQERPATVWFPSPSAEGGGGARRWRCLLTLAPNTEPATLVAGAEALARVIGVALGVTFDASTLRPEALTYVNPIPGVHRSHDDVTVVPGLALDVGALMVRAAALGVVTARSVGASRDAYRARVRDGASVVALLSAAGLLRGAPDARGWQPFECPRAEWHGSKAARRDTSTAVNVHTGACMCSHEHSRAPPSERGVARVRRVLEWVASTRPELAPAVALARDTSGLVELARELFTRPADGAQPLRVSLAAVGDTITEALSRAARERVPVLCTPPPGSGKSHAVGGALAALCGDVEYEPREDAHAPLACAVVIVRDRARIAELAAVILRGGLAVRVHTPVHDVLARPGHPEDAQAPRECAYHVDARRLYQRGASARASLCPAVPGRGPVPRVAPCDHIEGCAARDPWVPWALDANGTAVQALDAMRPGERWVAIVTAASAQSAGASLRQNAAVILDESDVILTPGTATLDAATLDAALRWARMLATVRVRKQPTGAPRILGVQLARAARDAGVNVLATLDGEARAAWCLARIAEGLTTPGARADVATWCDVVDDGDPVQLARLALITWCGRSTRHAITHGDAPDGATPSSRESEAFNALWRWVRGAHAEHDPEAGALSLAWPSDAAELARARGDMGVMCLDATGTPSLVRAALGAVHHVAVTVAEGADVRRVCVATRRAGRRALTPHGGVQWDAAGPALRGALGALRAARRDGFGRGPVVVFSALSLSLACEALATGVDVRALPRAATLPNERRERVAVAVSSAPPEAVTAVRELAGLGVTWCHYQGRDARGANHLQGAAAVITLGDARPELRATRTMLRALYREAPTPELARETGDRIAAAEAAQCHGRLRAVRREGERLCMVHVGHPACAPIDWRGVDGVQTVSLPLARRWGEAPPVAIVPTAEGLAVDAVTEALSDETAPVSEHAHPTVRACAALGYGIRGVAEATGRDRSTVRAWWHGRSQPRRGGDVRVLDALASGEGAPALRMMLRKQLAGRGWDALWRGVRGVPGLRRMLDGEGLTPNETALRVWCETGQPVPDAATLGALARGRPSLVGLYPPVVRALPPGATTRDRWMFEG